MEGRLRVGERERVLFCLFVDFCYCYYKVLVIVVVLILFFEFLSGSVFLWCCCRVLESGGIIF